jgi:hypothetical protein
MLLAKRFHKKAETLLPAPDKDQSRRDWGQLTGELSTQSCSGSGDQGGATLGGKIPGKSWFHGLGLLSFK